MGRTAKPRKRHTPRGASPLGPFVALSRVALLPRADRQRTQFLMQQALATLRTAAGTAACHAAWCNLADALNVAERLAHLGICSDRQPEIAAGQAALGTLHQRQAAGGTWVMRGTEIAALTTAVEFAQIQLQHCTVGELAAAVDKAARCVRGALAGAASPGAIVCVGGIGAVTAER